MSKKLICLATAGAMSVLTLVGASAAQADTKTAIDKGWGSPDFVDIHYPVFHGRLERMVRYGCEEEVVYPEVPA